MLKMSSATRVDRPQMVKRKSGHEGLNGETRNVIKVKDQTPCCKNIWHWALVRLYIRKVVGEHSRLLASLFRIGETTATFWDWEISVTVARIRPLMLMWFPWSRASLSNGWASSFPGERSHSSSRFKSMYWKAVVGKARWTAGMVAFIYLSRGLWGCPLTEVVRLFGSLAAVRRARMELMGGRVGSRGMFPSEYDWVRGRGHCAILPGFLVGRRELSSVGVGGRNSMVVSLGLLGAWSSWGALHGVGEAGGAGEASLWKGGIGIGGGVGLSSEGG